MPATPRLQDQTAETIGSRAQNFNVETCPNMMLRALGMDRLKVGGPADDLALTLPRALEQHRHDLPDAGQIERCLMASQRGFAGAGDDGLFRLWHRPAKRARRRAGTRAPLEGIGLRETDRFNECERGGEVLLRSRRESRQ